MKSCKAVNLSSLSVVLLKLCYWKESLFIYTSCGKKKKKEDWCVANNSSYALLTDNPNNNSNKPSAWVTIGKN